MGDIKLPDEALKTAIEIVKEPVDNLLNEPTKEIGAGLASIVNLVFSPFRFGKQKASIYFAHKLEVYQKELAEKEKSIPEDKRVEPDFHTVSLALENSKFCITDDDIRHMFVNLITSTMNSDTKNIVHPAHAEVLKQMNSVDAHIMESFYFSPSQPIVEIRAHTNPNRFCVLYSNLFLPDGEKPFETERMTTSITNLARLGIVNITYQHKIDGLDSYVELERAASTFMENVPVDSAEIRLNKGTVSLTAFGSEFISICLSSPSPD